MGLSSSSLLDESKSNYIRGRTEAELKDFSAYYRSQYLVAFFSKVQDEVEQQKTSQTQLLKQREPPKPAEVLYEENVLHFDDTRKWKERFVVVRANYSLECHDSYETFMKGIPPRHKLLPTGGTVLTSEEKYMVLVDQCCPDINDVKEEFAPPMATMPGQFQVYLRLPYRRDSYFCFRLEARRATFIAILTECIRHQNQDFLKKTACEVQAFLKAICFYRQERGLYESWDMLIGSDVRVLANLLMEELLPNLQTELLPRLKGKKTDRKKAWFATMEAAYILVQEQLLKGLSALKQECRETAKQQEALIRSDMDQIITSQAFLAGKLRATVTEPAEKFCTEHVQPHLASTLEELMGPISFGFQEARQLCERQMDQLCQDFQESRSSEELKQALEQLRKTSLQGCYQHVDVLQGKLQELYSRYNFSNCSGLVHSTQIDIQQLMEDAVYTFEKLLHTTLKDNPAKLGTAMEKAKHRVMKQYDYDSSTIRKKIFQKALLDITLPAIKKNLAPTFKPELQSFEQYIFADYSNFIQVENVYEDILLQALESEVSKVVKEAASLKKHNLFADGSEMRLISQSSLCEGHTPPGSTSTSPARTSESQNPNFPLLENGQLGSPKQRDTSTVAVGEMVEKAENPVTTETGKGDTQTPEAEEIPPGTIVAEKELTSSTPEAEKEITSNTVEADKAITPTTAEVEKQIRPSTPESEEISPSTPVAETVISPSTPEAEEITLNTAEKENIPSISKTEEDKSNAAEEEMKMAQNEDTLSPAETEEDESSAAETKKEDIPSAADMQTETAAEATALQSDAPVPIPSTDFANVENHCVSLNSPLAEAGTEISHMLVIDKSVEIADSGALKPSADTGVHSTGDPKAGVTEICVNSTEEVGNIGATTAEDTEELGTRSGEKVTDSDVSLTSDPTPEGTEDNTDDLSIAPVSEVTEMGVCVLTHSTPEIAEGNAVNLGDEPTSKLAVSPRVDSLAEVRPAEQPEQVKVQAPDCVKDIRDLVVEIIEVEELVQHYPDSSA